MKDKSNYVGEGGEKVSETKESSEGERARQTAHFLASKNHPSCKNQENKRVSEELINTSYVF